VFFGVVVVLFVFILCHVPNVTCGTGLSIFIVTCGTGLSFLIVTCGTGLSFIVTCGTGLSFFIAPLVFSKVYLEYVSFIGFHNYDFNTIVISVGDSNLSGVPGLPQ